MKKLCTAILFVFATSVFSQTQSPITNTRYVFSGTIKDRNGNPIPNVHLVCSNNCSVQTDSLGAFRLGFKPGWNITVTPESDIYNFTPKSVNIKRMKQDVQTDFIGVPLVGPTPPAPTGACCVTVSPYIVNCSVTTSTACTSSGGTYKGDGTNCSSVYICPPPPPPPVETGACCITSGTTVSCQTVQSNECTKLGGTYKGNGTTCSTANICPPIQPPPSPTGACCILTSATTMSCNVITQSVCNSMGGNYKGDNSSCSTPNICPTPPPPPPSSILPIAVDQNVFTQIDQPKAFAFSVAPAGNPTATVTVQIVENPTHGKLYKQDATVGKIVPFTDNVVPMYLFYVPDAGYVGTDSVKFKAIENSTQSSVGTITFNVQHNVNYTLPIGIPVPPFGIKETVESIYGSKDFFTHYVDPNHASSTDGSNPNGTLAKPRKSVPTNVPPGSVVAIKGGTFNSLLAITSAGTVSQPIFYRGLDPINKPLLKQKLAVEGAAKFIIFENIALDRDNLSSGVNITSGSNICMRNCDFAEGQQAVIITNNISNIVMLNNYVHDCGNLSSTSDTDENGFSVSSGNGTWLLDNLVARVAGSGMVTNTGYGNPNSAVQNVFMGRNVVSQSRQSGFWTKQATHCVFSQNLAFSVIGTSWAQSMAYGFQYGPEDVWFIFNRGFNCEFGIGTGSNSTTNPGQYQYIVGNIFHRIRPWNGSAGGSGSWDSAAIMLAGGMKRYIANNTIYDCSAGINCPDSGNGRSFTITNNIIANTTGNGNHIWVQDEAGGTDWSISNNNFGQPGGSVKIKFRTTAYNVTQLQSQFGSNATNNREADPMLINPAASNFRLSANSPCVDNGSSLGTLMTQYFALYASGIDVDFYGKNRVGPTDIGAIEYIP